MSLISYAIPEFEFLIDGVDIAPYITGLSLSPGISDITQHLCWSGDFELTRTFNATHSDDWFSELESPSRWRRGLQQISLNIGGYTALKFRIDRYRYYEGRGRGSLTQITGLADFDRSSQAIPEISVGGGNSLRDAIRYLLQVAFTGLGSPPSVSVPSTVTGNLDIDLITNNPIADAQRLAGVTWHWIWVDANENIQVIKRPVRATAPLLRRSASQVQLEPDEDNLNFAAEKVVITGGYQQATKPEPQYQYFANVVYRGATTEQKQGLDRQKRARRTETSTNNFRYKVFEGAGLDGSLAANRTIVESARKVVYYRYGDRQDRYPNEALIPAQAYNLYAQTAPIQGVNSEVIATLTLNYKTKGEALGTTDDTLYLQSVEIETQDLKRSYRTRFECGLEESLDGQGVELEYWDEEYIERGLTQTQQAEDEDETDPRTGGPKLYEVRGNVEEKQEAPEFNLETIPLMGQVQLTPIGWNTYLDQSYREDVGFIPDQAAADNLARSIALREQARRDAYLVELPVPEEWLAAGCPPFPIAHIGSHCFLIDAPILELDDRSLRFSFTGERLGNVSPAVKSRSLPVPFIDSGEIQIVPEGSIVGIPGESISIQLQGVNGTLPYTFTGSLPAGLSVSSSGLISGTIATSHTGTSTVRVTDGIGSYYDLPLSFEIDASPTVTYSWVESLTLESGFVLGAELVDPPPYYLAEAGFVLGAEAIALSSLVLAEAGLVLGAEAIVSPPEPGVSPQHHWILDTTDWLDSVGAAHLTDDTGGLFTVAGGAAVSPGSGKLYCDASGFDFAGDWKFTATVSISSTDGAGSSLASSADQWELAYDLYHADDPSVCLRLLDSVGSELVVLTIANPTLDTPIAIEAEISGTTAYLRVAGTEVSASLSDSLYATASEFRLFYEAYWLYGANIGTTIADAKLYWS